MIFNTLVAVLAATTVAAHGNGFVHTGVEKKSVGGQDHVMHNVARSATACNAKMAKRDEEGVSFAQKRRVDQIKKARVERGLDPDMPIKRRTYLEEELTTSHHSTENYNYLTPYADLFPSANGSCILSPDSSEGPFFVSGELIRHDIREDSAGIDLIIDMEWIDASTCEPVFDAYIDVWHANGTGVYSGINVPGNGAYDWDQYLILNETFFRGVQPTDVNGFTQFITKYPGHYLNATIHIHVSAHMNVTIQPNGTYTGGNVAHVGYHYFDQDLNYAVGNLSAYANDPSPWTENSQDPPFIAQASVSNPILEYVWLGDKLEDGVFAWGRTTIDSSEIGHVTAGSFWTADGGVVNPDAAEWADDYPYTPPAASATSSASS